MAWTIELSKHADRQFGKLDKQVQLRIADFIDNRLAPSDDPKSIGEPLTGVRLGGFWRFRVGDYRMICDIQDGKLIILVLEIGHRSVIYR
ncbi:MAG: addiction module toxin RelE [Devosia sp.]|nr:addiction module toxin RelE [Devosia sp.]